MTARSEIVEARGHLIDSQLLAAIFDKVIELSCTYEVLQFDIGRTNEDVSYLRLKVAASDGRVLAELLEALTALGAHPLAEKDGCVAEDFYSTTNHRTQVRIDGRWTEVEAQRMDAVIVVEGARAACRKLR